MSNKEGFDTSNNEGFDIKLKWNDKIRNFTNFTISDIMNIKDLNTLLRMAVDNLVADKHPNIRKFINCIESWKIPIKKEMLKMSREELELAYLEVIKGKRCHLIELKFKGETIHGRKLFNEFSALVLKMQIIRSCWS